MLIDVTSDVYPCCRDCIQPIVVVRDKLPDGSIMCIMMCPVQDDCRAHAEYLDKLERKEL